jgi:hypothetical protein
VVWLMRSVSPTNEDWNTMSNPLKDEHDALRKVAVENLLHLAISPRHPAAEHAVDSLADFVRFLAEHNDASRHAPESGGM